MQTKTQEQTTRIVNRAADYLSRELGKGRDAKAVGDEIRRAMARAGACETVQDAVVSAAARKVNLAPKEAHNGVQKAS